MAAIDKTYISNWEVFDKIRNWAKEQKIPIKDREPIDLANYLYYPDLTKEEWDKQHDKAVQYAKEHYDTPEHTKECKELYGEDWVFDPENYFDVVLWNTPTFVDIWLIRNCPFEEIQDRLKEQYGGGWSKQAFTDHNDEDMYDQIKKYTSIYDTYQRNGLGKKAKIDIKTVEGKSFRDKKIWWWINILDSGWWYDDYLNIWSKQEELLPYNTNCCTNIKGPLTKKNVLNLIRKWDLPKGIKLSFEALYNYKGKQYLVHKFIVTVK